MKYSKGRRGRWGHRTTEERVFCYGKFTNHGGKQYPNRFELMHVKDEIKTEKAGEMGGGFESTVLGKGILPVKEIIDLGKKSGGTIHFIIEQESYQGKTPVDSVKEDLAIMKQWGY